MVSTCTQLDVSWKALPPLQYLCWAVQCLLPFSLCMYLGPLGSTSLQPRIGHHMPKQPASHSPPAGPPGGGACRQLIKHHPHFGSNASSGLSRQHFLVVLKRFTHTLLYCAAAPLWLCHICRMPLQIAWHCDHHVVVAIMPAALARKAAKSVGALCKQSSGGQC